jgi:FkbM family methyltransferase
LRDLARKNMAEDEILARFQSCLRYHKARPWKKPLLNPVRFLGNQFRKYGLDFRRPGSVHPVRAFHFPQFNIVQGELVSEQIASYCLFEPELTEAFLHLIGPGEVVMDIGMHLGYFATLFAVLVGQRGEVHAFEPTPATREIGKLNTRRFPQIKVHPLAVWSSARTLILRDYGLHWMGFNSVTKIKLDQEPATPKEIEVRTVTLDAFSSDLGKRIALLKIDAESAEREIVAGGKALIERDRPLISVEVGDQSASKESRLLVNDLTALGYVPWEFGAGGFRRHEPRERYSYDNLIFAPADRELKATV